VKDDLPHGLFSSYKEVIAAASKPSADQGHFLHFVMAAL